VKPVFIHPAARAELDDAMAFYESRADGLGLDLQLMVAEAVDRLQRNPELWPPHKLTPFRKCFTHRFPFVIFYMELPDAIWIAAIAHGKRRPDYWQQRRDDQLGQSL
jgi:toxin ParE1/3/4